MTEETTDTYRETSLRAANAGRAKIAEVTSIFASIRHELEGNLFWRYYRCVSPGIQEFIEAFSFLHYLEHGTLVTHNEVQNILTDDATAYAIAVRGSEYELSPERLDDIVALSVSNFMADDHRHRRGEVNEEE
ncbi:hypothetical protein HWV62_30431 [Athelia sp. TMB]|nr:hypothetical protein HWV62_30431 [Athelia sp. TMB]